MTRIPSYNYMISGDCHSLSFVTSNKLYSTVFKKKKSGLWDKHSKDFSVWTKVFSVLVFIITWYLCVCVYMFNYCIIKLTKEWWFKMNLCSVTCIIFVFIIYWVKYTQFFMSFTFLEILVYCLNVVIVSFELLLTLVILKSNDFVAPFWFIVVVLCVLRVITVKIELPHF